LVVSPDLEALSREAAHRLLSAVGDAGEQPGPLRIALAGGSTPRRLYELLATPEFRSRIPWIRLHLFWGDERMVPRDHPQSNYRMVYEALLKHVPLPSQNIHSVQSQGSADDAAAAYEKELRAHFGRLGTPCFDLVLLGLGADGHTASLFPGAVALAEKQRLALAHRSGVRGVDRVTLTLPVLNNARRVFFLVAGENKASALKASLSAGGTLPAQQVAPRKGELVWLVDAAATARLEKLRVELASAPEPAHAEAEEGGA